eukprot:GFYU01000864.1.p1 GENE.GFYU01000864.1~~GFYU01000864.1.p1  ORF type:complete len:588 (-),score=143.05 GFYU01000864.1:72-1835(-)
MGGECVLDLHYTYLHCSQSIFCHCQKMRSRAVLAVIAGVAALAGFVAYTTTTVKSRRLGWWNSHTASDYQSPDCKHKDGMMIITLYNGHFPDSKDRWTTNDAFLIFHNGDQHTKSTVEHHTENPDWNEEVIKMCVGNINGHVSVEVSDHDSMSDHDNIGWVNIDMSHIMTEPDKQRYDLQTGNGHIYLSFRFVHMKHYSDIVNDLDTGDVVLFSSDSQVHRLIRIGSQSSWGHIGIVYKNNDGHLRLIESSKNSGHFADCGTGQIYRGVSELSLHDMIYSGYKFVAIRKMNGPADARERLREAIWTVFMKYRGHPYEKHPEQLLLAAFNLNSSEGKDTVFCSELIAMMLKEGNFIDPNHLPNNWVPGDFATETNTKLWLTQGLSLGTETFIKGTENYPKKKTASCHSLPGHKCECPHVPIHMHRGKPFHRPHHHHGGPHGKGHGSGPHGKGHGSHGPPHHGNAHQHRVHAEGCRVVVYIHKIYNIVKQDTWSDSDPYIDVVIDEEVKTTRQVQDANSYEYNESLCFLDDHDDDTEIQFSIKDADSTSADDDAGFTVGEVKRHHKACVPVRHQGELCYQVDMYDEQDD